MKVFIILSAVIALAMARPGLLHAPFAYTAPLAYAAAPVVPLEPSSQFHSQDSIGQYHYGYADARSTKSEIKGFDGVTKGAYSYVDAEGKVQKVEYTADDVHGFRVSATNLPVAPEAPMAEMMEQPKPVEDTPEVAKAKAEHFEYVKEAEARIAAEKFAPVAVSYAAPAFHHGYVAPAFSTYAAHPYSYYPYKSAFVY